MPISISRPSLSKLPIHEIANNRGEGGRERKAKSKLNEHTRLWGSTSADYSTEFNVPGS